MGIASPLSYLPPISNTPSMSSTLSIDDRNFIEFTRCLYGAKTIVKELEAFGATVTSTLCLPEYRHRQRYDLHISVDEFIKHVNQYLEESIFRFNSLCKIMLIILMRLEKTRPVKRECIDSLREELMLEWKKTELIKMDLLKHIHKNPPHPKKELPISPEKKPTTDDNEAGYCSSSETTPEPTSSESL